MKSQRLLLILIPVVFLVLGLFVVVAGAIAFAVLYNNNPDSTPVAKNVPPPDQDKAPGANKKPDIENPPENNKPKVEIKPPDELPKLPKINEPEKPGPGDFPKEIKSPPPPPFDPRPPIDPPKPAAPRVNPQALTINNGPEYIQLDYVRGLVFTHDYHANARTIHCLEQAGGAGGVPRLPPKFAGPAAPLPPFAKNTQPHRMVVCTAVFPMAKQVELYRAALQYKSQQDLFANPNDLPRPLGINVIRYELRPNGQRVHPQGEMLIQFDAAKRELKLTGPLQSLLRDAIYDEEVPSILERYLFEGLALPNPKLATAHYPNIQLRNIDVDPLKELAPMQNLPMGPMMPKGKGGPPPGLKLPGIKGKEPPPPAPPEPPDDIRFNLVRLKEKDLRAGDPALAERLFNNKFNALHALGQFRAAESDAPPRPPGPPMPGGALGQRFFSPWELDAPGLGPSVGPPKGPKFPPAPGPINWDRDAIVRFIDPEVVPGKTYEYAIQVRLANPNFKKGNVEPLADAEPQELPLDPVKSWVTTTPITIPGDYFLYLTNQPLLDDWNPKLGMVKPKISLAAKVPKDHARFQVHRWVGVNVTETRAQQFIGDWVIAEKLDVRRGDPVGFDAIATTPVWLSYLDRFEVPKILVTDAKSPKKAGLIPGIKLDVLPTSGQKSSAPILVDFAGSSDGTATEAMIITEDGRLLVLRCDAGSATEDDVRRARVLEARRRADEARGDVMWDKGSMMPKLP